MYSAQRILERAVEQQRRYEEVTRALGEPDIYQQQERFVALSKEHARLEKIARLYTRHRELHEQLSKTEQLIGEEKDGELVKMAEEERDSLSADLDQIVKELSLAMLSPDERDTKNCIVEIRAGTGGEEASLFVSDIFRMYSRYAERMGWKIELIESSETEIGGYREIIFSLVGENVFSLLKYESGIHRVQRIPATESSGRLHTSAISVAVLPEAEETDIQIKTEDIRVDVYRSSGPGGQSVNTTDSAVRITHLPSGLVVICQDEKSQHKNKAKALRVLRARLYEHENRKRQEERDSARRSIIGSGDRSERIRSYTFPQNRLSDHRIGLSLYKLAQVMDGDLQECIDALRLHDHAEA